MSRLGKPPKDEAVNQRVVNQPPLTRPIGGLPIRLTSVCRGRNTFESWKAWWQ
jgi:hypothetical protein